MSAVRRSQTAPTERKMAHQLPPVQSDIRTLEIVPLLTECSLPDCPSAVPPARRGYLSTGAAIRASLESASRLHFCEPWRAGQNGRLDVPSAQEAFNLPFVDLRL